MRCDKRCKAKALKIYAFITIVVTSNSLKVMMCININRAYKEA